MSDFVYQAPKFVDFEEINFEVEDKEKIESYFDRDHENPDVIVINDSILSGDGKDEHYFLAPTIGPKEKPIKCMRRSLSMSCLPKEEDELSEKSTSSIKSTDDVQKKKSKSAIQHHSKLRNAQLYRSKDSLLPEIKKHSIKYVSMAEAVNKFQFSTPERFRSKPTYSSKERLTITVPHSPALTSKLRHRPVTSISKEQQELLEFEEHQRLKFKAKPVSSKIFQGPVKPIHVAKKANTAVEPFKITEVQKKVPVVSPKPSTEFHAKSVPKSVYEYSKPYFKDSLHCQPITPMLMKRYNQRAKQAEKEEIKPRVQKLTSTKPVPFSFEKRTMEIIKKREDLIKKVEEEERKNRVFHARPMPKKLYTSPGPKVRSIRGSMESLQSIKSDDSGSSTFKARAARVLYTKPFIPVKPDRPMIEISEFQLNTEIRAQEREEFENKKKEREATMEEVRREREQDEFSQEKEEIARLRKEKLYVAQPIRRYKEVLSVPPKPITEPLTPKLAMNRIRNKENIQ